MCYMNVPKNFALTASQNPLHQFETECDIRKNLDTNEYPNIFVSKELHEQTSEYICIKFLKSTNVQINIHIENCANIRIYSNIQIFLHSTTLKYSE